MLEKKYDSNIITLALVKFAEVTPRTFDLLINTFCSLDEILLAEEPELAGIKGISASQARRISQVDRYLEKSAVHFKELAQRSIRIVTRFDDAYPQHLLELNDPPPLLYNRGKLPDVNSKIISLIGTEEPTQPGIAATTKIAKVFISKNIQVISSLMPGIDSAVHIGCRAEGGGSFAIIDKGFDHIEGTVEVPLAIDVVQTGGVISEYSPDFQFNEKNFNQTNRLMAGIPQAVIVTEFYESSDRVHDILEFSHQIGKLSFVLLDPENGVLSDEKSLALAVKHGAILMDGLDKIDDIIKSLV